MPFPVKFPLLNASSKANGFVLLPSEAGIEMTLPQAGDETTGGAMGVDCDAEACTKNGAEVLLLKDWAELCGEVGAENESQLFSCSQLLAWGGGNVDLVVGC